MIFIGFTQRIGRMDVESIRKFMEKRKDVERVILFCRQEPVDKVKELLEGFEVVVTKSPYKDAKRKAKEFKEKGKEVMVVDLQDFGERAIRDVC